MQSAIVLTVSIKQARHSGTFQKPQIAHGTPPCILDGVLNSFCVVTSKIVFTRARIYSSTCSLPSRWYCRRHGAFVNAVHQTERKHMVLFLMRIILSTDIQHCLIVPNESLTSSSSNTIPFREATTVREILWFIRLTFHHRLYNFRREWFLLGDLSVFRGILLTNSPTCNIIFWIYNIIFIMILIMYLFI